MTKPSPGAYSKIDLVDGLLIPSFTVSEKNYSHKLTEKVQYLPKYLLHGTHGYMYIRNLFTVIYINFKLNMVVQNSSSETTLQLYQKGKKFQCNIEL